MTSADVEQLAREVRSAMCPPVRMRKGGDGWEELPEHARAPWLAQASALMRLARRAAEADARGQDAA